MLKISFYLKNIIKYSFIFGKALIMKSIEEKYCETVKRETHLYSSTIKPYLEIKAQKSTTLTPWNSKFLGVPYIPKENTHTQLFESTPETQTKESLYLLAQINFEEIPNLEPFPEKGILQFWIARNDSFGLNNDPNHQEGFRVIYYLKFSMTT